MNIQNSTFNIQPTIKSLKKKDMNKILKLTGAMALGLAVMLPVVLTSCGKEEYDTNHIKEV